jgi:hypothetical protein
MHIAGASAIGFAMTSLTAGGNWVQDVSNATSDGSDWMDPNASSSGPDAVSLAANAIAKAHQVMTTTRNSIAVNTGMSVLSKQLTGNSVNKLI